MNTEADARIRTADPFITSEVLYQLSYVGRVGPVYRGPWALRLPLDASSRRRLGR